jgi:hypothetical protein
MAAVWSLIHQLEEHEGGLLLACHVIAGLAYGRSDFATMLPIRPDVRNRPHKSDLLCNRVLSSQSTRLQGGLINPVIRREPPENPFITRLSNPVA